MKREALNENSRSCFPESVPIHLDWCNDWCKDIMLCITSVSDCQTFSITPVVKLSNLLQGINLGKYKMWHVHLCTVMVLWPVNR